MGRVSDAREKLMEAMLELIWSGSYGTTSVDQICDKAGVRKGSFYYFFESKADAAIAALDADFQKRRPDLDAMFSPSRPPLERIRQFCDFAYQKQVEMKEKCGCALGCPLFTLGAEVSTQEQKLRFKVQEILDCHVKYFESAIRDAHALGLIQAPDVPAKARVIRAYYEGVMTQARIQNDAEILREIAEGIFAILGAKETRSSAA